MNKEVNTMLSKRQKQVLESKAAILADKLTKKFVEDNKKNAYIAPSDDEVMTLAKDYKKEKQDDMKQTYDYPAPKTPSDDEEMTLEKDVSKDRLDTIKDTMYKNGVRDPKYNGVSPEDTDLDPVMSLSKVERDEYNKDMEKIFGTADEFVQSDENYNNWIGYLIEPEDFANILGENNSKQQKGSNKNSANKLIEAPEVSSIEKRLFDVEPEDTDEDDTHKTTMDMYADEPEDEQESMDTDYNEFRNEPEDSHLKEDKENAADEDAVSPDELLQDRLEADEKRVSKLQHTKHNSEDLDESRKRKHHVDDEDLEEDVDGFEDEDTLLSKRLDRDDKYEKELSRLSKHAKGLKEDLDEDEDEDEENEYIEKIRDYLDKLEDVQDEEEEDEDLEEYRRRRPRAYDDDDEERCFNDPECRARKRRVYHESKYDDLEEDEDADDHLKDDETDDEEVGASQAEADDVDTNENPSETYDQNEMVTDPNDEGYPKDEEPEEEEPEEEPEITEELVDDLVDALLDRLEELGLIVIDSNKDLKGLASKIGEEIETNYNLLTDSELAGFVESNVIRQLKTYKKLQESKLTSQVKKLKTQVKKVKSDESKYVKLPPKKKLEEKKLEEKKHAKKEVEKESLDIRRFKNLILRQLNGKLEPAEVAEPSKALAKPKATKESVQPQNDKAVSLIENINFTGAKQKTEKEVKPTSLDFNDMTIKYLLEKE